MPDQPAVVDIAGLLDGDEQALARVAEAVREPCAGWGAFHVVGHGVAERELARFADAMQAFFALPLREKQAIRRTRDNAWGWYDAELTKNRRDWKEIFDFGPAHSTGCHSDGTNQWPVGRPTLRDALLDYYAACERIALGLLRPLCVSLGLAPDALADAFEPHTSFARLNRYAPCPDPAPPDAPLLPAKGHLGVHHHTDAGALTVLYQDDVPGLQIERRGRMELVEPVQGAFTINLGDALQVFTNDRFVSPVHRVVASPDRTRLSAPFFLNPAYDAQVTLLPQLTDAADPPHYRTFSWAEFRAARSAGDYADEGREVQIADYRIGG